MNYKRLGDYIREVNVRNTDLKVTRLLGLSMTKQFRPSTSNIVGVDLSKYKVVERNVFAFDTMSVIRVHKVPIAMNTDEEPIIVSPAYITFECIDADVINPQYLMMWFQRTEFDRYAYFKSDAAVRGGYGWDELCDTPIMLPPIDRQQELVSQYQTLTNRIYHNEQLIKTLESTAQTLYHKMFVENIDKDNLPEGWRMGTLGEFGKVITGKTPSSDSPEDFGNELPFITPGDFSNYNKFAIGAERRLSNVGVNRFDTKILPEGSVIVTCIGSDMGKVVVASEKCMTNQQSNSIVVNQTNYSDYLFYTVSAMSDELKAMALGSSTMPLLNKSDFEKIKIVFPDNEILDDFEKSINVVNNQLLCCSKEIITITKMQSLLLSKQLL